MDGSWTDDRGQLRIPRLMQEVAGLALMVLGGLLLIRTFVRMSRERKDKR